ncbi:MAG: hypothetical protein R2932_08800 [Caldilineaceae bacterium]
MLKDRGRAIALMHIQIDDQDLLSKTLLLDNAGRHGNIIEDAETRAKIGVGMVRSTSCITGNAVC